MTRKKDSVKLNRLHLVKRRRMQKYHARKLFGRLLHTKLIVPSG